jgi:MFS family permease
MSHQSPLRQTTDDGHTEGLLAQRPKNYAYRLLDNVGLITVHNSPTDAKLILIQRFVRVFGYGLVALNLAAYLSALGFSDTQIGMFFGLTLVGDFFMVLLLTQFAHVIGLKNVLVVGAVLMTMSGVVFALASNYWFLLTVAVLGVLSPSATEVGPFKTIEEGALFNVVTRNIVDVMAWYGTAEFLSTALGIAACGAIMASLQSSASWTFVSACRAVFAIYAGIGVLKIILSSCLSKKIETQSTSVHDGSQESRDQPGASPTPTAAAIVAEDEPLLSSLAASSLDGETSAPKQGFSVFSLDSKERLLLLKLCGLQATDSVSVGLSSVPWQTYFVRTRFRLSSSSLGTIFFFGSMLSAAGTMTSVWLSRRLGNMIVRPLSISIALGEVPTLT